MIDQKQVEHVGYLNYMGSLITNYAGCALEIMLNPGFQ
jgi:hypothetical protein